MPFDNKQTPQWSYSLPFALALMAPFDILASLAMDIYLPVVPSMPSILRTTPAMVQLTLSLYMVMLGVGQLLFGPLSDRFGRRPVLIGGGLVFALSSFALAITDNAAVFVSYRQRAHRRRWSPLSQRSAMFMPPVRKVRRSTAFSAPCFPSSQRSGRLPVRLSQRVLDGGRSSPCSASSASP